LNLLEIQRGSSANLCQTYFSLGLAVPNSTKIAEEGFQACLGEFEHPICNFAVGLKLDPWSTKQLGSIAAKKRAFNVYALPGDTPEHLGELLHRSNFRVNYRLAQLVAEPIPKHRGPEMIIAESPVRRYEVARFMTEQFFSRQTEGFRKRVAQATADATELELHELIESNQRAGAVMLCHSAGVVGIYNLCVASARRGFGLGKELTRWALSTAFDSGKLVTLQCDARLKPWYEEQGFCQTGTVEVYTLSKSGRGDIMGSS